MANNEPEESEDPLADGGYVYDDHTAPQHGTTRDLIPQKPRTFPEQEAIATDVVEKRLELILSRDIKDFKQIEWWVSMFRKKIICFRPYGTVY